MSVQHQNRQRKLIRQQITQQYQEQHALSLSGRNLEDELALAQHSIQRLETELAATQAALAANQSELNDCQVRLVDAESEAAKQRKRADDNHTYKMQCFRRFQEIQEAHNKLSKVVRLALSPEKYRYYRELAEE